MLRSPKCIGMGIDNEVLKWLNAATDAGLDEAGARELRRRLQSSEGREAFLEFMQLHLGLAERVAPVRSFSAEELKAIAAVEASLQGNQVDIASCERVVQQPSKPAATTRVGHSSRTKWLWLVCGLAASLLLMIPATLQVFPTDTPTDDGMIASGDRRTVSSAEIAARIIRKIDCEWKNDRWTVSSPANFRQGEWIRLSSGLLVLEFNSGAQVTLQGPVDASPLNENGLLLANGGMTAKIPKSARGFTVRTSSGEIVDLGTEFGVYAAEDGSVETHVFEGEVISRLGATAVSVNEQGVSLTSGQAQLVSATGDARALQAEPTKFLRYGFGSHQELYEHPPVDSGLVLWLAADGRVQLDGRGGVAAWGDNATGWNQALHDTWQVHEELRPTWQDGVLNGKPAIEFGGNAKLVSEPIELGSNLTQTVVFRLESGQVSESYATIRDLNQDARPDLGLQLLNLDGPPHPVLQVQEDLSIKSRVHLGWDPKHLYDNDIGVGFTSPILDDQPHIIVYSVDSTQGVARVYIDGSLVAATENIPELHATFTPRYIGQHPYRNNHGFPGHIAEVIVHDLALTPAQALELSTWLGQKYGIAVAPTD